MPRLDDAELDHLAALARLDLDPARRDAVRADLEKVLGYVDRLARYDDPTVAPLRHPAHDGAAAGVEALRPDTEAAFVGAPAERHGTATADEGAIAAALERRDGHVVVPRTVDADG